MQTLFVFNGDGWGPRIAPNGRRVIFGGGGEPGVEPMIRVWSRPGIISPAVPGRAGRFLADGTATFVRELDRMRARRYTLDVNGGRNAIAIPTDDDPNLVGGNDFTCGTGWASARVADMRLAVNNQLVSGVRARQVRARGDHFLVTEGDNQWFSLRSFQAPTETLWRLPVPPTAHFASLGDQDVVGYGYESFFGVLNHPSILDSTVLPWRRENNALVIQAPDGTLWAWSSGQRLDTGYGLVVGRQLGTPDVIEVPFDGSGGLDVAATDDGFLVAGTSDRGRLEIWLVRYGDVRGPVQVVRQAAPTAAPITGYTGYFYDFGKYGDYNVPRNCTVIGRGFYKDGDGNMPADTDDRIVRAAETTGAIFLAAEDIDAALAPRVWDRVHGVVIHEPSDPAEAKQRGATARAAMDALGLPHRRVIAVLTTANALDPAFHDAAEWLAVEIYFRGPSSTWAEQLAATQSLITEIHTQGCGSNGTPLILIPQAYDRSLDVWKNSALLLEAIQQGCQQFDGPTDWLRGWWWFAFARPGGTKDYPALQDWHRAQVQVTTRPSLSKPPVPTKPPPKDPHMDPIPGQAEFRDFTIFLHEVCYVQELQRAGGLFESPDPHSSRIFDPRAGDHVVVMDDGAFVWLGEYNQAFRANLATPGGPHEAAKAHVRTMIHNSDEARQKRGETTGHPQ